MIIAIASTKGGVAKTTTTASIGGYLASLNYKVLLIDANLRQPSLSSYYPLKENTYQSSGIVELLFSKDLLNLSSAVSNTIVPNLDIICSNDANGDFTNILNSVADGRLRLKSRLEKITGYDFILIDTIGAMDLTVDMSILASDVVIIPVTPEMLSAREFYRGTLSLFENLQTFQDLGFKSIPSIKVLFTKMERTRNAQKIVNDITELIQSSDDTQLNFIPDITVISNMIYRWKDFEDASIEGVPVHTVSDRSASIIQRVCQEIFSDIDLTLN